MSVNDNELIETLMKSYDALYQGNSKYLREQLIKLKQVELRELNFYQENEQGDTFVSLLAKNIEENKDLFKKMGNNLLKYIYEKIIQKYDSQLVDLFLILDENYSFFAQPESLKIFEQVIIYGNDKELIQMYNKFHVLTVGDITTAWNNVKERKSFTYDESFDDNLNRENKFYQKKLNQLFFYSLMIDKTEPGEEFIRAYDKLVNLSQSPNLPPFLKPLIESDEIKIKLENSKFGMIIESKKNEANKKVKI